MKKTILSIAALMACLATFAYELPVETASFQIDLKAGEAETEAGVLYFSESESYTDGYDEGYDSPKIYAGGDTLMWAIAVDVDSLAVVARPNLAGTFITMKANAEDESYKLVVSLVEVARAKNDLCILDHATNAKIKVNPNEFMSFTQTPGTRYDKRFEIIEYCDTAYSETTNTLCEREIPYKYKGTHAGAKEYTINTDTTIVDTIYGGAAVGCDSIATIHFEVNRLVPVAPEYDTICEGSFKEWRGKKYSEDGEFPDTVRYVQSGCDSAIYKLILKVDRLKPVAPEYATICEGSFKEWRGKKYSEAGEFPDTVRYVQSGCDSAIYKLILKVDRLIPAVPEDSAIICEGDTLDWREKKYSEAGEFYDTVRYVQSGCDSAIYKLKLTVNPLLRDTVKDKQCLADARAMYPRLDIQGTGIYYDTLVSVVTLCDSVVMYDILILDQPVLPQLADYADLLSPAVCGYSLKADELLKEVKKAAASQSQNAAKIDTLWLEMKMDKQFEVVGSQIVFSENNAIELRLVALTECEDTLIGKSLKRDVEIATPENVPALDTLAAVSKYNNWLLMINYNTITAAGYTFTEDDVTWYQVVNQVDKSTEIGDDVPVGKGFYYTADKSLTNSYYALIEEHTNVCGSILRTKIVGVVPESMQLAPAAVRRGETMTLSQLNPEESTLISIYEMDGKLVRSIQTDGVSACSIQANQHAGMYLLHAVNGDKEGSFKFIITE